LGLGVSTPLALNGARQALGQLGLAPGFHAFAMKIVGSYGPPRSSPDGRLEAEEEAECQLRR